MGPIDTLNARFHRSVALFTALMLLVVPPDAASAASAASAAVPSALSGSSEFSSAEYYSSTEMDADPTRPPPAVQLDYAYHNHAALTAFLKDVHAHYPSLTHLYSIGKSHQGRELWVLAVSSTADRHVLGKPEIKYVGNIHGNEPVSKEILLRLILHLVSSYGYDDVVTLLLDKLRVHFFVSMNPDGFEKSREGTCDKDRGRKNAVEFDLNRNFPDFFSSNDCKLQPEARAVIEWMRQVPFVLSAGLHGGELVASYPYENTAERDTHIVGSQEHASPDDDVFRHLATVYATNHPTMWQGKPCSGPNRKGFPGGITNGAKWYAVTGGMQDYNYIFHGTMEITLEVSCCKHPRASELKQHWLENKKALMTYMFEAFRGVRGYVIDGESGRRVPRAQLKIVGRERPFNATSDGEYWRILLNGNYAIQATADGYEPARVPFTVSGDEATEVNVTLYRRGVSRPTTASPWLVAVVRQEQEPGERTTTPDAAPPPGSAPHHFQTAALAPSSGSSSNDTLPAARWPAGTDSDADNNDTEHDDYHNDEAPKANPVTSGSWSTWTAGEILASHLFAALCTRLLTLPVLRL